MASEHPSIIEPGVYWRTHNGKVTSLQIDLNAASNAKGNGINLMPAAPVPDVNGPTALTFTAAAVRRLADELDRMTPSADVQKQLRSRLLANAEEQARVDGQQAGLREERLDLLREAKDAGIGVTELSRLTGVSRRGLYDMLGED